jgi:hypothetical protein
VCVRVHVRVCMHEYLRERPILYTYVYACMYVSSCDMWMDVYMSIKFIH